jgi:1-acyl-sn-glycerol-3-phosphate acyltransferase
MLVARSLAFAALFYLWSALVVIAMTPLLLGPRRWIIGPVRVWARVTTGLLGAICGVRVAFRGREHLQAGPVLIGAKHLCMFDTIAPLTVFADPCYVMRENLFRIPFYGWLARKSGMIGIDREGEAKALRLLLASAKARIAEGRQLVIFPEGTRVAPGTKGEYKPGVAALYRAIGAGCTPMATNSGVHWPAHGFMRRPGTIVYEFLEPIPAGLPREAFMQRLETALETASTALLGE